MKTKIDWTDDVLNIVWGCNRNCNKKDHGFDCYAKKFARRIGKSVGKSRGYSDKIIDDMINLRPVLFPDWNDIFDKTCKGKPARIFLNSMSDIEWWHPEWIDRLISKIKEYPKHTFLILTKHYLSYGRTDFAVFLKPKNLLLGYTLTNNSNINFPNWLEFLSIEPILTKIKLTSKHSHLKWIIVGADSTPGKQRVIPRLEWIVEIVNYCQHYNIPLFMKDSLKYVYGKLIQQYPGGISE